MFEQNAINFDFPNPQNAITSAWISIYVDWIVLDNKRT